MEERLLELLALRLQNEISEREDEELNVLLQEFPEYRHVVEKMQLSPQSIEHLKTVGTIRVEKEWEKLLSRHKSNIKSKGRRISWAVASVAAACCILFGVWYLFVPEHNARKVEIAQVQDPKKVIIEFADGKKVTLDKKSYVVGEILDSVLSEPVCSGGDAIRESIYNKLFVPRGCDFFVTLVDGTRVWLNADSRLEYPSEFLGDERVVYLEGEAFFDVAKNKQQPFILKTKELDVRVTGTSFNVMAYAADATVQATLVEGSVRVLKDDKEVCELLPGDQCVLERTSGDCTVNRVNPNSFIAWREGQFFFDNESMESLMRKIARWYDVEVFFEKEELKSELFYGTITRTDDISQVLDMLVLTKSITYEIKGKVVYIRN